MLILLLSGYNVWDMFLFLRILRIICFFVIFLDEISLFFGDLDISLCDICMCSIFVFEDFVDMFCGYDFCRGCWELFLNLKI